MKRKASEWNSLILEDIDNIIEQVGVQISDFEGKTILISGAAGFLGNYFLAVFSKLNEQFKTPCKVIAIDNYVAGSPRKHVFGLELEENPNFLCLEGDISKPLEVSLHKVLKLMGSSDLKIDYIIHAAGLASPKWYRAMPIESIEGIVLGLRNLMEYARKNPVKSFLYFSTSEIYGNPNLDQVPTLEDYYGNVSCTGPRACYDEAKRLGETMCVSYHRIHKIPVKTVRPFNVYGPGSRLDDDRVVPKFIYSALKGEELTVHVPGLQTRTFCYITDAMVGFFKALLSDEDGEAFNIGTDKGELNMESLANVISLIFKDKIKIKKIECPTEYPQDQALRRCPNINKARKVLLYEPKIDLVTGLQRTVSWSKMHLKKIY